MTSLKNKQTARLSLESFKATVGALHVKDDARAIGGGALATCHIAPPSLLGGVAVAV